MLVHSQRTVGAESTAERRALNGPPRVRRRLPVTERRLRIPQRYASVNCKDMFVSAECAVFREVRWQRGEFFSVLMAELYCL